MEDAIISFQGYDLFEDCMRRGLVCICVCAYISVRVCLHADICAPKLCMPIKESTQRAAVGILIEG